MMTLVGHTPYSDKNALYFNVYCIYYSVQVQSGRV